MAGSGPRDFPVTPPSGLAWMSVLLLAGALPLAIVAAVLFSAGDQGKAWVVLPVLAFAIALPLAMRRRSVRLANGVLRIRAAMYSRQVPVAAIDLDRARIVNLDERTELRPLLKTNGMAVPGFSAGHFRLRDHGGKAFCLVTDKQRVLWLPMRDAGEKQLLLSLEQPQALLDALRRGS